MESKNWPNIHDWSMKLKETSHCWNELPTNKPAIHPDYAHYGWELCREWTLKKNVCERVLCFSRFYGLDLIYSPSTYYVYHFYYAYFLDQRNIKNILNNKHWDLVNFSKKIHWEVILHATWGKQVICLVKCHLVKSWLQITLCMSVHILVYEKDPIYIYSLNKWKQIPVSG